MAIGDWFKPKWKQSDKNARIEAVNETKDADLLVEMAGGDTDEDVRCAALHKINDLDQLERLAPVNASGKAADLIQKKLGRIYKDRALNANDAETWQQLLGKIQDDNALVDIVRNTQNVDLRTAAIERVTSADALVKIATHNCGKDAGMKAVARIDDEALLEMIKGKGANKAIRHAAERKLLELNPPEEPDRQEEDLQELVEICEYAESVQQTYNFEGVARLLEQKGSRLKELDPAGEKEASQRFIKALEVFQERREKFEAKQAEELAKMQAESALKDEKEAICAAVGELTAEAEDVTGKLGELKEKWEGLQALTKEDEEESLQRRFDRLSKELNQNIHNLEKAAAELGKLTVLCEEIEGIAAGDDLRELKRRKAARFPEVHHESGETNALKARFEKALASINGKLDAANQREEEEARARHEELEQIVTAVEKLVVAEDRRAAQKELKVQQEKWTELNGWGDEKLTRRYKKLLDDFWDKQREFRQEEEWNEWANVGIKDELIQIVEKTAEIEDLQRVAKIIREAQKKWKKIGPVPRDKSEDMWQRFHKACEANYERCKGFFEEKDEERKDNLEHCLKLCAEAELLVDGEDWGTTIKRYKELQADWKEHGNLPRGEGDEAYKRFRTACDRFFSRLDEHHKDVDSHREENQKLKEELVAKAEALLESEDTPTNAAPCVELQSEWKKLGPGLKEKDDETWERFRGACDKFFGRLEEDRERNVPLKEKLCEEVEAIVAELNDDSDRKAVAQKIMDLQKKWKEIGPLPKGKQKELWKRFREPCDKFFEVRRKEYEAMSDDREKNLALKQELVVRAESMMDSEDWRETAEAYKELQAEWKSIGPVSREHDKEIWERFRGACDAFFERRKATFDRAHQRRLDNLQAKEELVASLEMLIGEDDETEESEGSSSGRLDLADELQLALANNFAMSGGGSRFDEVKRIQAHWKEIGPVPRENDKDLWNRYRSALDRFYGNSRKAAGNPE